MLEVIYKSSLQQVFLKGVIGNLQPIDDELTDKLQGGENDTDLKQNKTKLVNSIFNEYVTAEQFTKIFNNLNPSIPVELIIISPGGSVSEAEQMLSVINNFRNEKKGTVNIVAPSLVASCATFIALSGDKLTVTPQTQFIIHSIYCDAKSFNKLDYATLEWLKNLISESNNNLAELYANNSNQPKDFYLDKLNSSNDIEFDYKQLQEYGFRNLEVVDKYDLNSDIYTLNLTKKYYSNTDIDYIRKLETNLKLHSFLGNNVSNEDNVSNSTTKENTPTTPTNEAGKGEPPKNTPANENNPSTDNTPPTKGYIPNPTGKVQDINEKLDSLEKLLAQVLGGKDPSAKDEKQRIAELFNGYENDPAYNELKQNLLNGGVTFEAANNIFNTFKANKQKETFLTNSNDPMNDKLTFNKEDLKRALLLKNSYIPLSEDEAKKQNTRIQKIGMNAFLSPKDITLSQLSYKDLLIKNILFNTKKSSTEIENLSDIAKNKWVLKNLSTSDLKEVIEELTTYYWDQGETYKKLTDVVEVCKFRPISNLNPLKIIDDKTGLPIAKKMAEGGEIEMYTIKLASQTYSANRYGLAIRATYESLLNDTVGIINNTVNKLIFAYQRAIREEIISSIITAKSKSKVITGLTKVDINTLDTVMSVYNCMTDSQGASLDIEPSYIFASGPSALAIQKLLMSPTDPSQDNPNVVNPYFNGYTGDKLKLISDPLLNEKLKTILGNDSKNDIFFIPKDNILFLAESPQSIPTVENSKNYENGDMKFSATGFFGIAVTHPEEIVVVEGKALTGLVANPLAKG